MGPVFGRFHEAGPQRITLHIAADDVEMLVIGERKALESPLIQMPVAARVVMTPISKRMGRGHPSEQLPHLTVLGRPKHKMPMIGHQRKRENFDGVFLKPLTKNPQKGLVVVGFVEDFLSLIAPIEDVVNLTGSIVATLSRHNHSPPPKSTSLCATTLRINPRPVFFPCQWALDNPDVLRKIENNRKKSVGKS